MQVKIFTNNNYIEKYQPSAPRNTPKINNNDDNSFNKDLLAGLFKKCCALLAANIVGVAILTAIGIGAGLGIKALSPQLYGGSCVKDTDCYKISDYGFVCQNKTCNCSNAAYYSPYKCVTKKTYLTQCNYGECNDNIGLSCVKSTCVCTGEKKWNGTSCALGIANAPCNSTSQCQAENGLFCSNKTGTCICVNSTVNFWNDVNCEKLRSYNKYCIGNYSCDSSQLLYCSQNANSYATCSCPNLMYFNSNSSNCTAQKSISASCQSKTECRLDLGLTCDNTSTCVCDPNYYWSSTNLNCTITQSVNETCSNKVPCNPTVLLTCQNNICDCASTHYWDGTICTPKKGYNETCNISYECNDAILLYCSNTCICPDNYYYDGTQCSPLKEYYVPCSQTYECYTPGQLSCMNGVCDCPLPISQKMYWVPALKNCLILPKSCLEIQQSNSSATSGIYYLASSVGLLEAYCEMDIDGGGYTFVPWESLSQSTSMLKDIYIDTSKVLFRLISRSSDANQPYILTKQLNQYSNVPIGILENSYSGYSKPNNLNVGSYVFVGFLPASMVVKSMTQGVSANGYQVTFSNCDGNPNSYMALFGNRNPTSPSNYGVGSGMLDTWKSQALPHPLGTYMPVKYFYFAEMHQGGCGGYAQSDRWSDYYGVAFGMK